MRNKISLVSQDVILFDDTIKNNIAYADAATEQEIQNACKFAAADEFIEKTSRKYETMVGENGVKTIRWTKTKRISIARAILKSHQLSF